MNWNQFPAQPNPVSRQAANVVTKWRRCDYSKFPPFPDNSEDPSLPWFTLPTNSWNISRQGL